ncbi:PREDICTED: uncharacterized protein LOC105362812 [Ceratosolen solmsi marchali]|uniref:Uncharacterized protein LOC105362812 n=1 Tax=Ceratosolen solmsi marchali TaxID=326594 RepID=A0AAJ6YIB4_9HYME|nr:PREDICTED: uncharacterized protein LOC105362812 [Ceratosolen solmsi marchali]
MAGLFSIFNEAENNTNLSLSKGKEAQLHVSSKMKFHGNVSTPAKIFTHSQNKPKGLSIRSKSDLNISSTHNSESSKLNSKECLKSQSNKQSTPNKQAILPIKTKMAKNKSFENIIGKKLSPKISSPIMQNVVDNFVFRKPEAPKQPKKLIKCSEPENLAYYFDHNKHMNEEMDSIFNEERRLLRAARKLDESNPPCDDEGFISGSEIDFFEIHSEISSSKSTLRDVELPEISDIED